MATSQDFVNWVCSQELDWRYLKYLLMAEKESFLRFASGTTHQTIYFPEVKAFHVCLPSIVEQRRIAEVLGALDDKIDSSRRLGAMLAELVSAMFRHHVVEQASDDWRTGDLTAIARFVNGRAFTKDANGLGRPILRIKELSSGLSDATLYSDIEAHDDNIARHHDLLFAWSGSLDLYCWHGPESLINQHIFKVLPVDGFPSWFVAGWIREHMLEFQRIARDKATTMGHIKREHLTHAAVRIPPRTLLIDLDAALSPLDAQMGALAAETITLTALRNALLPRLVSGKIRVPDTAEADDVVGVAREGTAA
jgi:type I restriction enzyme S subunit